MVILNHTFFDKVILYHNFPICGMKIIVYMNDIRPTTTISLQKSTVQRLVDLGKFNESYDDVVTRLIEKSGNTGESDDE